MGWISRKVDAAKTAASAAVQEQMQSAKDSVSSAVKEKMGEVTGKPAPSDKVLVVAPSGRMNCDVVGESHYVSAIASAVGKREGEHFLQVSLERERGNRYDPNAVRVAVGKKTVGYVPSERTSEFHPLLDVAERAGVRVVASGRVWYSKENGGIGSVTFDMRDPAFAWPLAFAPADGASLWPIGRKIKVSVDDSGKLVVRALLRRAYSPGRCAAHLRLDTPVTGSKLQVSLDGEAIGEISAATSAKMREVVEAAAAVGRAVYVVAEIVGNDLAVEVSLRVAPPAELSNEQVTALVAPVERAAWAPATVGVAGE